MDEDSILLAASQQFEEQFEEQFEVEKAGTKQQAKRSQRITRRQTRFSAPVTDAELEKKIVDGVPQKTRQQTKWAIGLWMEWRIHRIKLAESPADCPSRLTEMGKADLCKWLSRFIVEIRRNDGKPYTGTTLHQILCGIQRFLREEGNSDVDFFSDVEFRFLKNVLDSEMKELRAKGIGTKKKQVEPISASEEEQLWERGVLGDKDPQTLLDTMVWMCGLYFALRSGGEHRNLCPRQIELIEAPGQSPCLRYYEDVSKNNPGGLKHRKVQPKSVVHYANPNPARCFVRLYKLYCSKCPPKRPENAFYLTPLGKPTEECWYSSEPVGHNMLGSTVKRLCHKAGVVGYKTNHSLRVTAATRLFQHGVDEQVIMNVTGHHSTDGVRAYKRMCEEQYKDVSHVLQVPEPKKGKNEEPEKENMVPVTTAQEPKPLVMPPAPLHAVGKPGHSISNGPVLNFTGCSSIVINYKL